MNPILAEAERVLDEYIESDPATMSGAYVIKGTRILISSVFAELTDDCSLKSIAEDFGLDHIMLREIFMAMAVTLENP